jgi:hypothetical protein
LKGNINKETQISNDIAAQITAGRANIDDMEAADSVKATISLGKTEDNNPWLARNVFAVFIM